jgi:hypothetical protein
MSDGATTSAPAAACDRACFTSASTVGVVQHVARRVDEAVLTVGRVRIERDVGDDAEAGLGLLERAHHALDESLGVPCLAAVLALCGGIRHREEGDRRDTERIQPRGLRRQEIEREPLDARHRCDRLAPALALDDESGWIRSSAERLVSRASRRENGSRRMRRIRVPGKLPAARRPIEAPDAALPAVDLPVGRK